MALSQFPEGSDGQAFDTYRWLARCLGAFEREPERLEELTMIHCPLGSFKFKEAVARLQCAWVPRMQLGAYGSKWPPDIMTLSVSSSVLG